MARALHSALLLGVCLMFAMCRAQNFTTGVGIAVGYASDGSTMVWAGGDQNSVCQSLLEVYSATVAVARPLPTLPQPMCWLAVASPKPDTFLIGGGESSGSMSFYDTVCIYTPSLGTLDCTTLAPLQIARSHMVAASANGWTVFAGGFYGPAANQVDAYAPDGRHVTATLSRQRKLGAAAGAGTRVYIAGGYDFATYWNTIDVFDTTTESISTLAGTLSTSRIFITPVASADLRYVGFCCGLDSLGNLSPALDLIDTTSRDIVSHVNMPKDVAYNAAAGVNNGTNQLLVFAGGNEEGVISGNVYFFDVASMAFVPTAQTTLAYPRQYCYGGQVGTTVVVGAGKDLTNYILPIEVIPAGDASQTALTTTLAAAATTASSAASSLVALSTTNVASTTLADSTTIAASTTVAEATTTNDAATTSASFSTTSVASTTLADSTTSVASTTVAEATTTLEATTTNDAATTTAAATTTVAASTSITVLESTASAAAAALSATVSTSNAAASTTTAATLSAVTTSTAAAAADASTTAAAAATATVAATSTASAAAVVATTTADAAAVSTNNAASTLAASTSLNTVSTSTASVAAALASATAAASTANEATTLAALATGSSATTTAAASTAADVASLSVAATTSAADATTTAASLSIALTAASTTRAASLSSATTLADTTAASAQATTTAASAATSAALAAATEAAASALTASASVAAEDITTTASATTNAAVSAVTTTAAQAATTGAIRAASLSATSTAAATTTALPTPPPGEVTIAIGTVIDGDWVPPITVVIQINSTQANNPIVVNGAVDLGGTTLIIELSQPVEDPMRIKLIQAEQIGGAPSEVLVNAPRGKQCNSVASRPDAGPTVFAVIVSPIAKECTGVDRPFLVGGIVTAGVLLLLLAFYVAGTFLLGRFPTLMSCLRRRRRTNASVRFANTVEDGIYRRF